MIHPFCASPTDNRDEDDKLKKSKVMLSTKIFLQRICIKRMIMWPCVIAYVVTCSLFMSVLLPVFAAP